MLLKVGYKTKQKKLSTKIRLKSINEKASTTEREREREETFRTVNLI
jgi:hypothetical protein